MREDIYKIQQMDPKPATFAHTDYYVKLIVSNSVLDIYCLYSTN